MENEHAENLRTARKKSTYSATKEKLKDIKDLSTPKGIISLLSQLDPFIDWLWGIALALALLKDILDWIINFIPAIGQIMLILLAIMITIAIGMIMFITGAGAQKKMAGSAVKKILILSGGAIAEMIPAVDFLPIETVIVIVAFAMVLLERKAAARENSGELQAAPA